jgi:hypothetical protein
MKKLFLLGLSGGAVGAITGMLITEAIAADENTLRYIAGALLSMLIAIYITDRLYKTYINQTKVSRDTIDQARQALNK